MAEMMSSAFLQVVFQIAAGFLIEELRLERDLQNEVQLLKSNVNMIGATLSEAEKKTPSLPLKHWLDELRDVGYEAIDLLDEHNTELLRRHLVSSPEVINSFWIQYVLLIILFSTKASNKKQNLKVIIKVWGLLEANYFDNFRNIFLNL
jgi:Rx N-terminal domain